MGELEGIEPLLAAGLEMRAGIGTDVVRLAAERATTAQRAEITAQTEVIAAAATPAEVLAADRRFWQLVLDAAGNLAYQLAFNSLIRAVHGVPEFSVGWLEHELERCDYRRPIARAIAAHDPDAAAAAARDALAPAAEMLSAVARSSNPASSQRK